MAISQRLVDPYREFKVSVRYSWQESYHAALLENDWTRMVQLVQAAESEIHKRRLELSKDHNGTQEEREAVVNALNGLRVLRMDAAAWRERQSEIVLAATYARNQLVFLPRPGQKPSAIIEGRQDGLGHAPVRRWV